MDSPSRQDVERQLRLVLASPEFESSPKLSELLYYLVTETLAGNSDRLKGYTIGVDVFDRQPDFDQGVDAIVRVQMGRLRKLIKTYYAGSGAGDPIRIVLVSGRYAPRFELASGEELSEERLGPPPVATKLISARAPQTGTEEERATSSWQGKAAVGIFIAIVLALIGIGMFNVGKQSVATRDRATERPRGPLVYISEYQVIGPSDLAHQLAVGLQYDLVNQLAKYPDIAVLGIDTVSGTTFKQATEQPVGADFVLGGAIELMGDTVRITSQLRQTGDGRIIWSDQSTADSVRPVTIVKVQADIAATVASQIGQSYGVISQAMAQRVATTADPSLEDYRCVLSAYAYMRHKTQDQHGKVRSCLEQAIDRSPKYATAWALLSWIYGDEERYGFNKVDGEDGRRRSLRAAERAVAADANSATAYEYLSIARFLLGDDDPGAREAAEHALRLSPNDAEVLADAGWTYAMLDGNERSRQLVLKALELNPGHPAWYWGGLAIHALQNGLKADALKYARLNISDRGPMEIYLMAAAQRLNGQTDAADEELRKLYQSHPEARDREHMMDVLRIPPKIERLIFGNDRAKTARTAG